MIFGGKAAPGYRMAKLIIRLINGVADVVNRDPKVSELLKVVFLPDFNVKNGQHVYPAADLSEQISTAGKEASGTGNMKFAMNGALTIGTLDGANVEIRDAVGHENFFLFGLTADEVTAWKAHGYRPRDVYESNPELREAIDADRAAGSSPTAIASCSGRSSIRCSTRDDYMLLADYQAYVDCQQRVSEAYRDRASWTRMSILNSARVGRFSSDRSIREYCRHIWHIDPPRRGAALTASDSRAPTPASGGRAVRRRSSRDRRARAHRSAPPSQPGGVNFSVFAKSADARSSCCCSTTCRRRSRRASIPLDPKRIARITTGTPSSRISRPGRSTPTAPTARSRRSAACGSIARRCCSIPYGLRRRRPATPTTATPPRGRGDNAASAMKSVVADPGALRLGGRYAAPAALRGDDHLRAARRAASRGIPAPAWRPEKRGHLRRPDREDSLPAGPRHHRRRAAAGVSVRSAGRAGGRVNYWGYQPISFFAPHHAYSSRKEPLGVLDEFRDMVKAFHRAGIEVILDVVFNHTAEGGHDGPTLCYRGLANELYYILETDRSRYADYTGCGNTLNANQPIVRRLIQDSLRYWVTEMHVDGFRFDLASVLSRDETGHPLPNPPVLWDIESDPLLAGTKLIAEAWDAAGLYQVGSFVGDAWQEWNGRFRDDVRRFLKGRQRHRVRAWRRGCWAAPTSTRTRNGKPSRASTSSPATTASR